ELVGGRAEEAVQGERRGRATALVADPSREIHDLEDVVRADGEVGIGRVHGAAEGGRIIIVQPLELDDHVRRRERHAGGRDDADNQEAGEERVNQGIRAMSPHRAGSSTTSFDGGRTRFGCRWTTSRLFRIAWGSGMCRGSSIVALLGGVAVDGAVSSVRTSTDE